MILGQVVWNAEFIGGTGIVVFVFVGLWALLRQNKDIWNGESGKSVSVIWFMYFLFLHIAIAIYALSLEKLSWPLLVNGVVRGGPHIPILIGLYKFKGFSRKEKWLLVIFSAGIAAMFFLPYKEMFFIVWSVGAFLSMLTQPYEIRKEKDAGVVNIHLLIFYLIGSVFWIVYSAGIRNWAVCSVSISYLFVSVLAIAAWIKYRKA